MHKPLDFLEDEGHKTHTLQKNKGDSYYKIPNIWFPVIDEFNFLHSWVHTFW